MRVSDAMVHDLARRSVAEARARAVEAQRAASSGVRVDAPSDDPIAASGARRAAARRERIEAMLRTANTAVFSLQVADAAFEQAGDLVARARELAIQGANATLNAADRAAIAQEVGSIREALIGIANTSVDGRYVLAGFRDDVAPFDAAGNFVGDLGVRELEVAPGVKVTSSVPGGDVLAPAGGTDVLATLESLHTALASNDPAAARTTLTGLERSTTQISEGRARVGASMESLEMAQSLSTRLRDIATEERSSLVEVDTFDALTELARADQVLQQAVAIAARLPLPGLAQRMG